MSGFDDHAVFHKRVDALRTEEVGVDAGVHVPARRPFPCLRMRVRHRFLEREIGRFIVFGPRDHVDLAQIHFDRVNDRDVSVL